MRSQDCLGENFLLRISFVHILVHLEAKHQRENQSQKLRSIDNGRNGNDNENVHAVRKESA